MLFKKILLGGISLALLGAGCAMSQPTQQAQKESIKIGGIFALSGIGSAIGGEEMNGAQLAINDINAAGGVNDQQLELVVEDISLDKMAQTPAAARKLIDIDKVIGIVGPTWDEPADQLLPITEEVGIPIIGPDQTNNVEKVRNFTYHFSTWHDNRVGIRELLRYAQKNNLKRIAIIRPIPAGFWQFTRDLFIEYAPEFDVRIVADENINDLFAKDYRTFLVKATKDKPDAIFIVMSDPTQCGFMKQIKELGITIPILATESAGNSASLEECPELLEQVYFSSPKLTQKGIEMSKRFEETFGHAPKFPSAMTSYDAVVLLASAIEKGGSTEGNKIKSVLEQTQNFSGASTDSISFDEKGFVKTPEDAFGMFTVRNGTFTPVQ